MDVMFLFESIFGLKVSFNKSLMVGVNDSWLPKVAVALFTRFF